MAFSFNSIGHFFASKLDQLVKVNQGIEAFVAKANLSSTKVEQLTALLPVVGVPAVQIERGVYAVAGEVAACLQKNDPALQAHLLDAGLDQQVVVDFQTLIAQLPAAFAGIEFATAATPAPAAIPAPAAKPAA